VENYGSLVKWRIGGVEKEELKNILERKTWLCKDGLDQLAWGHSSQGTYKIK